MSFKEDAFMQPFVTDKQKWYEVETSNGTEVVPFDLVGVVTMPEQGDVDDEMYEEVKKGATQATFEEYVQGETIFDYSIKEGYGARMSAPGYMDCTEWTVFDTPEKAIEHLDEMYGDDEEDDDEEDAEIDADDCEHNIVDQDEDGKTTCTICGTDRTAAQAMFDAESEAQECLYVDCHKDCAPDSDYCVDHADYEKTTWDPNKCACPGPNHKFSCEWGRVGPIDLPKHPR